MAKYKVGQLVKVVDDPRGTARSSVFDRLSEWAGKTVHIKAVCGDAAYKINEDNRGYYFDEEWLVPVREYDIGEKVRIVNDPERPDDSPKFVDGMNKWKNKIVTIQSCKFRNKLNEWCYGLKETGYEWAARWLEPVEEDASRQTIVGEDNIETESATRLNNKTLIDDSELEIVINALLGQLKHARKNGKSIMFPPERFLLPDKKVSTEFQLTGEKNLNFSFMPTELAVAPDEEMRLLGATLYHLMAGRSEYNHESFLMDGYRQPLESDFWPVISLLLSGSMPTVEEAEQMLAEISGERARLAVSDLLVEKDDTQEAKATTEIRESIIDAITRIRNLGIKVISHEQSSEFWNHPIPEESLLVRYCDESILEAVQKNHRGEKWMLVYYNGQSFKQKRLTIGADPQNQPCFDLSGWWLSPAERRWAEKNFEAGYYLVDFSGKFGGYTWQEQENQIRRHYPLRIFERCHELVVADGIMLNYKFNRGEKLLFDWRHWGREIVSNNIANVTLGDFNDSGLTLFHANSQTTGRQLKVVVARKFDF